MEEEPIAWMDDTDTGQECPVWLVHQVSEYFTAWNLREKGILPRRGGWAEQEYYWIEAFEVIGAAVAKAERRRLDQMKGNADS